MNYIGLKYITLLDYDYWTDNLFCYQTIDYRIIYLEKNYLTQDSHNQTMDYQNQEKLSDSVDQHI